MFHHDTVSNAFNQALYTIFLDQKDICAFTDFLNVLNAYIPYHLLNSDGINHSYHTMQPVRTVVADALMIAIS